MIWPVTFPEGFLAVQTYRMGNKQEMVVAVRAPEGKQGPIEVALTTDVAQDLFLHWGVRKQGGGDWVAPPKVQQALQIHGQMLFPNSDHEWSRWMCQSSSRPWNGNGC